MSTEQHWFHLCCALLRGEQQSWPPGTAADESARFHDYLLFHGIDCLIQDKLALLDGCPSELHELLRVSSRKRAMWELRNRQTITQVLEALHQAGITALVLKGTALAYSLYENPVWRTRSDTDLLVAPAQCKAAMSVLAVLAYVPRPEADAIIVHQRDFVLTTPEGSEHSVDLHWFLNDSPTLSALFSFDELHNRAQHLPALGQAALALSAVDAMVLACLHRESHQHAHYTVGKVTAMTADRLVWICDIDRLARTFTQPQWQQLFALARDKGLSETCARNLALAHRCFATVLPPQVQQTLTPQLSALPDRYLQAGPLQRLWLDLLVSRSLSAKAGYCRRLLLPPAAYMRHKYADAEFTWLPWLYLRRALGGIASRLWRGGQR